MLIFSKFFKSFVELTGEGKNFFLPLYHYCPEGLSEAFLRACSRSYWSIYRL